MNITTATRTVYEDVELYDYYELLAEITEQELFTRIDKETPAMDITLLFDVDDWTLHGIMTRNKLTKIFTVEATPAFNDHIIRNSLLQQNYEYGKAVNMIFGNGSGEEFAEYLRQIGIPSKDVEIVINTLSKIE